MADGVNVEKGRKVCSECSKKIRDRFYSLGDKGPMCYECYIKIINTPQTEKSTEKQTEPRQKESKKE